MLKKIGFITVGIVAGLVFLNTSYGHLAWNKVKNICKKQITPEMKVEMIREEVANLGQDLKKQVSAVAEETVAVDNLRDEIDTADKNQKKQFDIIVSMKKDLESGQTKISYGDKEYPASRIRAKLDRDWESYKRGEETLKSKRQLLEVRERALTASRERLEEMRAKKVQLELEVEKLEADLKNARLSETRNQYNFDEGRVGDIQKSISEVRDWIKTKKVEGELQAKYSDDPIPVEKKATSSDDTFKEIEARLNKTTKAEDKVVEKASPVKVDAEK